MYFFWCVVALFISVTYFGVELADLKGWKWRLAGDATYLYAMLGLLLPS